jgi:hypothetical protein
MPDLSKMDTARTAEDGAVLEPLFDGSKIIDETTKKPAWIRLRGVDSRESVAAQHAVMNRQLKKHLGRKSEVKTTSEELDVQSIDLLAKATMSWGGWYLEGKEFVCNVDNARLLYTRFPWIREQAQEFVNDRANYLGN